MTWDKLKNGDLSALGELYDTHIDMLYRYGFNICSDKEYVKDCIHDLFVDLYKYRANLSQTTNVEYYLLRALKNKLSKKYHFKTISMEIDANTGYFPERLDTESEEDKIIALEQNNEKSIRLETAMGQLTKQQRKVINLRFIEEKSYAEIAGLLNISVETARTIIYRGIKMLRKNVLMLLATLLF